MKKQTRKKIATILLYIVSCGILAFGILYVYTGFTKGLMPYHVAFLGKTCDELDPKVCELMKTFVVIIGIAFLSVGATLFMLTRGLFNNQQDEQDWAIFVTIVAILAPITLVMWHLATYTPWYLVGGIFLLSVVALALAYPGKKARS